MSETNEQPTMWDIHTCGSAPTHRCAACWAEAYDEDGEKRTANLARIGYPPMGQPPTVPPSDTASDEQAEKLRQAIISQLRLHQTHTHVYDWLASAIGDERFHVSDDGTIVLPGSAFTTHVLPAGELERLRDEIDSYESLAYMLMPCGHFECYCMDHQLKGGSDGGKRGPCALCIVERQSALIEKVQALALEADAVKSYYLGNDATLNALATYDRDTKGASS